MFRLGLGTRLQIRNTTSVKYFGKIQEPVGFEKADDTSLSIVAALGNQDARRERLLREIMRVDKLNRHEAFPKFREIVNANRQGLLLATLPQRLGITIAVGSSIFCLPAVFDRDFVMWFNENYVTADIPEPKDLETWLEVGAFAWNWVEPFMGAISFVLLCLQFARSQMQNLGSKPFTRYFLAKRADRLIKTYPQYDYLILEQFSETDPLSKFRKKG